MGLAGVTAAGTASQHALPVPNPTRPGFSISFNPLQSHPRGRCNSHPVQVRSLRPSKSSALPTADLRAGPGRPRSTL